MSASVEIKDDNSHVIDTNTGLDVTEYPDYVASALEQKYSPFESGPQCWDPLVVSSSSGLNQLKKANEVTWNRLNDIQRVVEQMSLLQAKNTQTASIEQLNYQTLLMNYKDVVSRVECFSTTFAKQLQDLTAKYDQLPRKQKLPVLSRFSRDAKSYTQEGGYSENVIKEMMTDHVHRDDLQNYFDSDTSGDSDMTIEASDIMSESGLTKLADSITQDLIDAEYNPLKDTTLHPMLAKSLSKFMIEMTEKFNAAVNYNVLKQQELYDKKINEIMCEHKQNIEQLLGKLSIQR